MKFLVFTRPVEGIQNKLPRSEEFETQLERVRRQLNSGRFDCAYHGENRAVAIVNADLRAALEELYAGMPLGELTIREIEQLEDLPEQMERVLESLRKARTRGT
jgi:SepF-like predicted cell division protein (DUF552 family)